MKIEAPLERLTNVRWQASWHDSAGHQRRKKKGRDGGMKRRRNENRWGAATPTAVLYGKDFSMSNLPESQWISKCPLSAGLTANLQPFLGLIESDWRRISSTVDPLTEVLLRQAHDALGKLYETHVSSGEARRS